MTIHVGIFIVLYFDVCSKAANEILQQVNNLNKKLSAVAISNAKEDIAETRESLKAVCWLIFFSDHNC